MQKQQETWGVTPPFSPYTAGGDTNLIDFYPPFWCNGGFPLYIFQKIMHKKNKKMEK